MGLVIEGVRQLLTRLHGIQLKCGESLVKFGIRIKSSPNPLKSGVFGGTGRTMIGPKFEYPVSPPDPVCVWHHLARNQHTICPKTIALQHLIFGQYVIRGAKKPININNFAGLSRKWVGVKLFMCFPLSRGKRETHKQNSQEISGKGRDSPGTVPGKSRDNPVKILFMCFLVYWFFSRP